MTAGLFLNLFVDLSLLKFFLFVLYFKFFLSVLLSVVSNKY